METARKVIAAALHEARRPAVLCSFGKDSMLLLHLVREALPQVPVIWFRTGQDERFAKRMIAKWNLMVVSWAPAAIQLLINGDQRTLALEYAFGPCHLPVLVDLEGDGPCALKKFARCTPELVVPFDLLFLGYKDTDSHWVRGDAPLFPLQPSMPFQLCTPLRHMEDEQVLAHIDELGIPYQAVKDTLALSTACMTPEPLDSFRHRFGLEASNGPSI